MDVLTARHSTGGLHAITADYPPGFGPRFEQTMKMQGLTVTRYSADEWREYCSRRTEVSPPQKTVLDAPVQPAELPLDKNRENAITADSGPAQEIRLSGLTLPTVGETIVHPVIGYSTVTHVLALDGQAVPVATGPRGSGMVRPGEWRAAQGVDMPRWLKEQNKLRGVQINVIDLDDMFPPGTFDDDLRPVGQAAASTGVDSPQPAPAPLSPEPASSSSPPAFKPGDWIRQHASGIPHQVSEKGAATLCGLGIRSTATLATVYAKTVTCGQCEKAARLSREAAARRGHA